MFSLFKKKSEKEKLIIKYTKLLEEGFKLSNINRKDSDTKYAEAEDVRKQIENL